MALVLSPLSAASSALSSLAAGMATRRCESRRQRPEPAMPRMRSRKPGGVRPPAATSSGSEPHLAGAGRHRLERAGAARAARRRGGNAPQLRSGERAATHASRRGRHGGRRHCAARPLRRRSGAGSSAGCVAARGEKTETDFRF
jgi:hypothetical protein